MDRTEAGTVAILPGFPIEDYLQSAGNGWNGETCAGYRRALCELARSLVGQGPPTPAAVQAWRQDLERRGYRPRSINSRLAAANGYFRWCGRYDLLLHYVPPTRAALPAMTRPEYLRLLRTARSGGQQQLYLLVKLFALTGLPLQCLPGVTPAVHAALPRPTLCFAAARLFAAGTAGLHRPAGHHGGAGVPQPQRPPHQPKQSVP